MTEPKTFKDILELQKIHEEEVNKPREDGFVAREKKYHDLRGALMDEFMEFFIFLAFLSDLIFLMAPISFNSVF